MAFQEVCVLLLIQEAGNVARDSHIEAIQDSEDQLWSARDNEIIHKMKYSKKSCESNRTISSCSGLVPPE